MSDSWPCGGRDRYEVRSTYLKTEAQRLAETRGAKLDSSKRESIRPFRSNKLAHYLPRNNVQGCDWGSLSLAGGNLKMQMELPCDLP